MSKNNDEWWDSYEEMRKVAKIIRDIMGWECFTSWDDYKRKYGLHEYGLGAGKPFTTPTPVAFYDGEWRVFSPDHEQLDVFDPLHNLNDAMKIAESHKFMEVTLKYAEGWKNEQERWQLFECSISPYEGSLVTVSGATLAEAICDAALQAIEHEGQKQEQKALTDEQITSIIQDEFDVTVQDIHGVRVFKFPPTTSAADAGRMRLEIKERWQQLKERVEL